MDRNGSPSMELYEITVFYLTYVSPSAPSPAPISRVTGVFIFTPFQSMQMCMSTYMQIEFCFEIGMCVQLVL